MLFEHTSVLSRFCFIYEEKDELIFLKERGMHKEVYESNTL